MDQQTLLATMTVFVIVAAVALIIQAGFLFGVYKASRGMNDKVQQLMPKIQTLLDTSNKTLNESRQQIAEITSKANVILDLAQVQVRRVDEIMEDAHARAKVQMDRAEMILDDAMIRAQRTAALVEGGIAKPIREIQGVAAGIRAALLFLTKGRPNPSRATSDEEMFI
jgi:ElaB/YqjD/DUF883 family membrane-anchored ribosome-binding protein